MRRLLNRLLRKEEIRRGDGTIYLNRWTLFRGKSRLWGYIGLYDVRVYIHKFTAGDGTKCLHDHPNTLRSFVFWNGYVEYIWDKWAKNEQRKEIKAPCYRKFPASHTHRVELRNNKPGWTLVIMSPKKREWGFFVKEDGKRKWVKWYDYERDYGGVGGCD